MTPRSLRTVGLLLLLTALSLLGRAGAVRPARAAMTFGEDTSTEGLPSLPAVDEEAVRDVATSFLAAWQRRDLSAMYGLLAPSAKAELPYESFVRSYQFDVPRTASSGQVTRDIYPPPWTPAPLDSRVVSVRDAGVPGGRRIAVVYWEASWTVGSVLGPEACDVLLGTARLEEQRDALLLWFVYADYKHRVVDARFVDATIRAAYPGSVLGLVPGTTWLKHVHSLSPDTPVRIPHLYFALGNVCPLTPWSPAVINFQHPFFLTLEMGAWRIVNAVVPAAQWWEAAPWYPFSAADLPPGSPLLRYHAPLRRDAGMRAADDDK